MCVCVYCVLYICVCPSVQSDCVYVQVSQLNASVEFLPHPMPLYRGRSKLHMEFLSVATLLQRLVQQHQHDPYHRHVLVLHYYAHWVYGESVAEYRKRVRKMRQALQPFLESNPKAQVFIRGPHVISAQRA